MSAAQVTRKWRLPENSNLDDDLEVRFEDRPLTCQEENVVNEPQSPVVSAVNIGASNLLRTKGVAMIPKTREPSIFGTIGLKIGMSRDENTRLRKIRKRTPIQDAMQIKTTTRMLEKFRLLQMESSEKQSLDRVSAAIERSDLKLSQDLLEQPENLKNCTMHPYQVLLHSWTHSESPFNHLP